MLQASSGRSGKQEQQQLSPNLGTPVHGTTKRLRPGLVNKRRKNCIPLPAAGRRTQFFQLLFTKPGRSLLAEPCGSEKRVDCVDRSIRFSRLHSAKVPLAYNHSLVGPSLLAFIVSQIRLGSATQYQNHTPEARDEKA